jgi:hypothetical protein
MDEEERLPPSIKGFSISIKLETYILIVVSFMIHPTYILSLLPYVYIVSFIIWSGGARKFSEAGCT